MSEREREAKLSGGPSSLALASAFAGCALIWGSTFLIISIGNDTLPPVWAAALRLGLASLILVAITFARGQDLPRGAARKAALLYGFFTFGVNLLLLYWAEKWVPSGLAAVFYATSPLSSTFIANRLGLERITWMKVGAAAIAFIGVLVIFSGQIGGAGVSVWPLVALLVAVTSAAFGGVMLKRGPRQSPLGANAVACFVGFAVCLVVSFATGEPHPIPNTSAQILPLLYLTVAGSVVAFVLFSWLVNHWDVSRISFVSVLVPLVAMTLGSLVRHERLTPMSWLGSALVLAGVALRIWNDRRDSPQPSH